MLRKKHCKSITKQGTALPISQIDNPNLAANSELDGRHKLTLVKCIVCPQDAIFLVPNPHCVRGVFTILVVFLERSTERQQRVNIICTYKCREHNAQNEIDAVHLYTKSLRGKNRGSPGHAVKVYFIEWILPFLY